MYDKTTRFCSLLILLYSVQARMCPMAYSFAMYTVVFTPVFLYPRGIGVRKHK